MYRYGELTFSYSFFPVWTHKLRFLAKLLHIPKRAKNAIFTENLEFFVFFGLFRNSLFRLFRFYTETESFNVLIELKQTGDPPKQFKREFIWVFFWTFRVVSVCYETVLFVSVVSIKIWNTETNPNFKFLVSRNKPKQTRNRSCFGLFRFKPK